MFFIFFHFQLDHDEKFILSHLDDNIVEEDDELGQAQLEQIVHEKNNHNSHSNNHHRGYDEKQDEKQDEEIEVDDELEKELSDLGINKELSDPSKKKKLTKQEKKERDQNIKLKQTRKKSSLDD